MENSRDKNKRKNENKETFNIITPPPQPPLQTESPLTSLKADLKILPDARLQQQNPTRQYYFCSFFLSIALEKSTAHFQISPRFPIAFTVQSCQINRIYWISPISRLHPAHMAASVAPFLSATSFPLPKFYTLLHIYFSFSSHFFICSFHPALVLIAFIFCCCLIALWKNFSHQDRLIYSDSRELRSLS